MADTREVIFDTETTGLNAKDGDRVIEIGAVELINRFSVGRTFHIYLNPGERQVHPDAQAVHGISNEDLKDKPSFASVLPKFMEFFGTGTLIAHNAKFDVDFLNAELARAGEGPIDPGRVVDTLALARRKHPAGPNSLDALCDRYGVSRGHRTLHGALLDSELLAEVYLELTGGRQAGLGFDTQNERSGGDRTASSRKHGPQAQREKPLPSRLTDDDRQAHHAFLATLGDNAVWSRWQPEE